MTHVTERADVVVIGGGVIGCAIAWALASSGIDDVVIVEREPDVGEGASKANSAIVHTGFDAKHGSIEATLLRRAASLWPEVIDALEVPFLRSGALMLARSPEDLARLRDGVRPLAEAHGVLTELLDAADLRSVAPYVTETALAALSIPDESIIDPFWLTRAYAEAAMSGGTRVIRGRPVTGLAVDDRGVRVELSDGRVIEAEQAVDAAGLRADEIARMAGEDFAITPRRGQFLVSEETFGVDRIVLPVPGPMGKGMLVTPIVFGGILLGPTAHDEDEKDDRGSRLDEAGAIVEAASALVPDVAAAVPVRSFVGLRPVSPTGDFILRPSAAGDRLWLACGIRSTGISVSPAVGMQVAEDVLHARGWAHRPRHVAPPPFEFAESAGDVACLCRGVSVGELAGACARPLGPTTLDGVKRRGGAMFGDCQGNLCAVRVAGVLAEQIGIPITEVEKGPAGSWVFAPGPAGPVVESRTDGAAALSPPPTDAEADLVVVGLGRAGRAAARTARDLGIDVVGVDREAGVTAVGLIPDEGAWFVETQSDAGAATVRARAVLVATGGYVQPREQRPIPGPRPAGIVTSDLVEGAVAAGLLPGRRVVVVGSGSLARLTAERLNEAGASVVARLDREPLAVRGGARLEAVETDAGWLEADTLVFADRLVPQPFLLRPLGLVDGRPGTPAPADADGRLALPGLWAAGCCTAADPDHRDCEPSGVRVAESIVASLAAEGR
jgi:glycerol-3-phosphate dehydrogenase